MKLKKKTSILMAASATVAAVGIAAVSFAAWQGSGNTDFTAQAATGYVALYGFDNDAVYNENAKLFPYNQDLAEGGANDVTIFDVKIPAVDYTENCTLTITFENTSNLTLLYSLNDTATANNKVQLANTNGYDPIATVTQNLTLAEGATVGRAEAQYLHIILDSDNNSDMNKSFSVKVELKAAE